MAKNTLKGLTIEIGGDTTNLGKALEDVNKKSGALSSELNDINRLLKMDPSNTELLAQKQAVLAASVTNTKKKLDTLKDAEKQVQAQFERGEVSEEQVRALQREIIAVTAKLDREEQEAKQTGKSLKDFAEASDKAGEAGEGMGNKLASAAKVGLAVVSAAATAALGAMVGAAEGSRDYRRELGKLDTAFTTAGHSSEAALSTYQALQGVLGETDQAVEAANHLAQLANNEEDLAAWTNIATGVYATFGASLPIENITEAANETAKTGKIVGGLADALNWAGVSEEQFQAQLDACTNEQERQALITSTLNGLYSEAAEKYKETNAEVIRANEANEAWAASMAEVGAAVDPILTDVKMMGATLLSDFLPGITGVTDAFRGLINGEDGAAGALGEALSGIVTQLLHKVTELAPTIVQTGVTLITTLVTTLVSMLPELVTTGVQLITTILDGLTSAIPILTQAIVDMVPLLVQSLVDGIPLLIQAGVDLLLALLEAIPLVIPPLVAAIPDIVLAVIDGLLEAIPQLIEGALTFLMAIVEAVPLLIRALTPKIPTIIKTVVNGLLSNAGLLADAAVTLFFELVKAIPTICRELLKALPQIGATILGELGKLPGKVLGIGADIVRGLWNGIKDMASWVKNKIKGFANDVLEGIKNFFGIHSPSTETAWMGKMMAEGMAKGIAENADMPLDAMSDLQDDLFARESALNGLTIDRQVNATFGQNTPAGDGLGSKLDRILAAIERGQVLTIDGDALVGSTLTNYDNKLGQRLALAARGAL